MAGQPVNQPGSSDRAVADQVFYRSRDGSLCPTPLAAGPPWLPGTQHGSMIVALAARAVAGVPSAVPMQLARLTVDLSRPVPIGATTVRTSVSRDGRRVQVVDLDVEVEGVVRARASALRIRVEPGLVPAATLPPAAAPADLTRTGPDGAALPSPLGPDPLWDAHRARWESYAPGEGSVWLRPHCRLVEDEPLTPTVRAALVADLIMSGGGLLPPADFVVVNPDLSLLLERPPDGEWINVRSRVRVGPDGLGQSEGTLHDRTGRFARVCKSLLVSGGS
ncbi:MAG TPA: thioesterase family protein [Mycobacteriales bacterium]|jgi:hypothetical protein|nr:thioesterase family protein [Mycobacteriales bacterium]